MDKQFLLRAIEKAKESTQSGGFPAGAIIVKNNEIVSEATCVGNIIHDPTAHGETVAIREACKKLETTDLSGATLYASMEPCIMCLGSAMWSSISRIVYACSGKKVSNEYYGGSYNTAEMNSKFNHPIEIIQIAELENESLEVVKNWEKSLN